MVVATTVSREHNTTGQKTPLLEGVYLVMHTSLYFGSPFNTPPMYVGTQLDCIRTCIALDQPVGKNCATLDMTQYNPCHGVLFTSDQQQALWNTSCKITLINTINK